MKKDKRQDLPDQPKDKSHLQGDEASLNLPDVNEIPVNGFYGFLQSAREAAILRDQMQGR